MEPSPQCFWPPLAALAAALLGLAGCTSIRADVAREESHAVVATDGRLARAFDAPLAAHPGRSGVAILEDGPLAWVSRVALADVAERSIDVQYYIYEDDRTGLILLQRLKAAADRGVRVRLLIDDNNNVGRDLQLAGIDRHPRIQVRIFNPLQYRERWTRPFQYLFDLERAQRRMHNKIYAVDGIVAIVGARSPRRSATTCSRCSGRTRTSTGPKSRWSSTRRRRSRAARIRRRRGCTRRWSASGGPRARRSWSRRPTWCRGRRRCDCSPRRGSAA